MINLYPSQMRALAAMCDALDAVSETAVLFHRIEVMDPGGDPIGYLVDEVGGSYSWAPPGWFNKGWATLELAPSTSDVQAEEALHGD